jgi:serine/threonine protein kinase
LPADADFCPRCGTRTPTQISSGGTTAVAMPPDQLAEQQVRLQAALGPDYAVERLLGSGGFAAVWAAFDRKLQREVAVKVLHPDLVATRSLLERFQREAQAVAKLRHPGVIPIYAVGEHEGLAFYVMPLVEGESLRERLSREGALAPDEVRRILREVAAALTAAHKAGIVHRDIKPENLMLEGSERRVVVMDFGIAKSTAGAGADQTGLTGTGMIIGTPAYMSPEQATGSKEIDVRSDVYSLGVVGFEMLAGRPPFKAASVPELIMEHVATPAPSVSSVRADTPEDLAVAVNRCLQKEPGQRWKSAGDLSGFLERVSTPAAQVSPVSKELRRFARRGWRPSRRQVYWTVAGAMVIAAVLASHISPADVRVSVRYWLSKVGLVRLPPPPPIDVTESPRRLAGAPDIWALGGSVPVLSMGGSGLAVVDGYNLLFGLHVFDGQAWRSYRTPEPIEAAATQGKDILLFGARNMYRWSAAGVVREDTVPFAAAGAWADAQTVVIIGGGEGQLAARDAHGWRRMASRRRTRLAAVAGTGATDLVALGYFAGGPDRPDSIIEYDGTSWETLDPRPAGTKEVWVYDAVATLGDRSLVAGGRIAGENRPLLLVRTTRGHWRRVQLQSDSAITMRDAWGIWGASPDDFVAWDPSCAVCRIAEVRKGVLSESPAMGRGSVVGVARAAGVQYAVWADGTVWARREGRWVFATEVPNIQGIAYAYRSRGDWSGGLQVGPGRLRYGFWERTENAASAVLDSALDGARGAAVARRMGWALGGDGVLRRIDCMAGGDQPCRVVREPVAGGLALQQRTRGGGAGGLLVGERGLLMLSDERGVWRRLSVPAALAGESLFAANEGADGRLAVLGPAHVAVLDSLGTAVRVTALSGMTRPVGVLLAQGGAVALIYRDHMDVQRLDGSMVGGWRNSYGYAVSTWLALADGRLLLGVAGDPSDPFANGAVWVFAVDSTGLRSRDLSFGRERSRVTALVEAPPNLLVATASGIYRRPLASLPFAPPPSEKPAQVRPQ